MLKKKRKFNIELSIYDSLKDNLIAQKEKRWKDWKNWLKQIYLITGNI